MKIVMILIMIQYPLQSSDNQIEIKGICVNKGCWEEFYKELINYPVAVLSHKMRESIQPDLLTYYYGFLLQLHSIFMQ